MTPEPEGSAGSFRAASSVQACAAAPACGCRPMFPRCVNIGELGRISQMFKAERLTDALGTFCRQRPFVSTLREKAGLQKTAVFQRAKKRGRFLPRSLNAPGASPQPSLNALGNAGDIRSPRRRKARSRNLLPALNVAAVVQALSRYSMSCANGMLRQNHVCKVRGSSARAERLGKALFGLQSQCRRAPCARLRLADLCFRFAAT